MNKLARFKQAHPEFEQVELAFITYKGLKENIWSKELVDRQMTIRPLSKLDPGLRRGDGVSSFIPAKAGIQ